MFRRLALVVLILLDALLWLASTNLRLLRMEWFALGGTLFQSWQIAEIIAFAVAVSIGALSRRWQGAIALTLIASVPALIFNSTLGVSFASNLLYLATPLAALGWFGWLLRFVRAEFSA